MIKRRPTKAIIPVAGYGTRRLPISKSIEKCMLPFLNRPLIDYIVEDCKQAGITDIIFVISDGAPQLKSYYSPNKKLQDHLLKKGKTNEVAMLDAIGKGINFHYIEQSAGMYGTTVPIWSALDLVRADEAYVVLMGDDIILRHDGGSSVDALIQGWMRSKSAHAMLAVDVPKYEVSNYGVLKIDKYGQLETIVERPQRLEDAPSTMINVSKYVFSASINERIERYMGIRQDDEYMLIDVVNEAIASGEHCHVFPGRGVYLDGGTVQGWLRANNYLASLSN